VPLALLALLVPLALLALLAQLALVRLVRAHNRWRPSLQTVSGPAG
jgi:hypothetical protein